MIIFLEFQFSRNISSGISYSFQEESAIDSQGETASNDGTYSHLSNRHSEESIRTNGQPFNTKDSSNKIIFQSLISDLEMDDSIDCQPSDILVLPRISRPEHPTARRRTLTNDMINELQIQTNRNDEQFDPSTSWNNIPEKNNELEREEFILYIQRNSGMTFAGLIKRRVLSETYLKKLVRIHYENSRHRIDCWVLSLSQWYFLLTRMADLDEKIEVIQFAGENSVNRFSCRLLTMILPSLFRNKVQISNSSSITICIKHNVTFLENSFSIFKIDFFSSQMNDWSMGINFITKSRHRKVHAWHYKVEKR